MDKIITILLRDALTDIENLQEYYNTQKKYVHQYVKDNVKRYKYGILLDRFFLKKVMDLEEIEITEEEQKVIDDIISEYKIEEKEEGTVVKYKLDPEKNFSDYEMNPQIARTNFSKLIQQPNILNESVSSNGTQSDLSLITDTVCSGRFTFLIDNAN